MSRAAPFEVTVLTMFPEAFPGPLGVSLIGTAWREAGLWSLETLDIRGFSKDKRTCSPRRSTASNGGSDRFFT
jgi:tRNA G37 N-methylase TrmD